MKEIALVREYESKQTLGNFELIIDDEVVDILYSMEVVWDNNKKGASCIPAGEYLLKPHKSPKYGECYIIIDKYNDGNTVGIKDATREYCLVHPANYSRQLKGCVSLGLSRADIDSDGLIDVTNSKKACKMFYDWANGEDIKFTII